MATAKYNYAAAFVTYAECRDLVAAAETHAIPYNQLRDEANAHGWRSLVHTLPNETALMPPSDVDAIKKNRDSNLAQAVILRDKLNELLGRGTGTYDPASDVIVALPVKERAKALRDLAGAAARVHELTYRALGDVEAGTPLGLSNRPQSDEPRITVIIPAAIAMPRTQRTIDMPEVIEEEPVVPSEPEIAPTGSVETPKRTTQAVPPEAPWDVTAMV